MQVRVQQKGKITLETLCIVGCGRCPRKYKVEDVKSMRGAIRALKEAKWHCTRQRGWVCAACWNPHWRELRGVPVKDHG